MGDFDEWLARIICYAFSVPPQWATKVMNRATADNQSEQAEDEGLEPTKEWVKDLIDEIIADEFASPDLELVWLDEDQGDPKGLEAALEGRLKLGAVTLNEMRDALGLDPYPNPAADRPMVLTAAGYVPIEGGIGGDRANGNAKFANEQRAPTVRKIIPGQSSVFADRSNTNEISFAVGKYGYNPEEPRIPKHNVGGGQWTREGWLGQTYAAATQIVVHSSALTGIQRIDDTTKKLANILAKVVDQIGPSRLPPWIYGTLIHTTFASAVRAAGLPGVEVEGTFSLAPTSRYGSKDSKRPDVILRDEAGEDIVAIYDVKTGGAELDSSRVDDLRAVTRATQDTYVIEMSVPRGIFLKLQV